MSDYILTRIKDLEAELETLKKQHLAQTNHNQPKTQLRGIWKGTYIPDTLFEEAERSLISKDDQGEQGD